MSEPYVLTLVPSKTGLRLLLTQGPDELMRAVLPQVATMHHEHAMPWLLRGLALWLDCKIRVVLSAGGLEDSWSLGLTDELGLGVRCVYYEVQVAERGERRRRGRRIRGVGDFSDARQMALLHGGVP